MSTKNHKTATTSHILPGTDATNPPSEEIRPTNPQFQQSNNPPSSSPAPTNNPKLQHSNTPFLTTRARCGKVPRLPKEIRDQLNEMLLDGTPHAQIIQKLKETFASPAAPQTNVVPIDPTGASSNAGASDSGHESRITIHDSAQIENQKSKIENLDSLTPHHLTTWKKYGGYRDWLRDQQRLEECRLRHELTLDLARSAEGLASYQAAPKVAVAQICQTIIDLGPEGLKEAMQASPLNCFRLLNALARLINSGLKCETQIHKAATATDGQKPQPVDSAEIRRIEKEFNLL
jgi:hypothetical protein